MNNTNRAVFTAGFSRETRNDYPAPYAKRAKTNERQWREHIETERRDMRADTEALSRF